MDNQEEQKVEETQCDKDCEHCQTESKCPMAEDDPTEKFDVTRQMRVDALTRLAELAEKWDQADGKMNKKDIKKAFTNLLQFCAMTDAMTIMLLKDIYRVVTAVAQGEVNVFALRTHMKAIIRALDKKGLVPETELAEIHDKEILYQELPEEMKVQLQQVAQEAVEVPTLEEIKTDE